MMIFDFDGTIADTVEEALRIVNRLAPKYDFPEIDGEKAQALRSLSAREVIRSVGIKPRRVPKLMAEMKSELRQRIETIEPIRDVASNLRILKERGVFMGILTSNSRENVEAFLAKSNLDHCFSFLETGSPLFGKARLLRRILEKRPPDGAGSIKKAIYVGDETRDISAARRVGIRSAAVCWGANTRAALEALSPDFLLDHPIELIALAFPPNEEAP